MNIDDDILMAYADGELDPRAAADVERALAADPVLAATVQRHRELRRQVHGALASLLAEPVPAHLTALLAPAAGDDHPEAATPAIVTPLAEVRRAANPRDPGRRRRLRSWAALAASLVLGVLLVARPWSPPTPDVRHAADGRLVADGTLAAGLDAALADGRGDVAIGLTFRDRDGRWCRTYRHDAIAGLACRDTDGQWQLPVLVAAGADYGSGLRPAATALPAAVLAAVDARIAGEPVDAAGERAARDGGWR